MRPVRHIETQHLLLRLEPHGLFSCLVLNSSSLSAFFALHPVVSALSHGGASSSEQLSLISSGLALRQSRCAIRGSYSGFFRTHVLHSQYRDVLLLLMVDRNVSNLMELL